MPRRAARKDGNHDGVCQALEAAGWAVLPTFQLGHGWPDALACKPSRIVFVEIKDGGLSPSRRRLTPDEQRFRQRVELAGLEYAVVNSIEEAVAL